MDISKGVNTPDTMLIQSFLHSVKTIDCNDYNTPQGQKAWCVCLTCSTGMNDA